MKKYIIIIVLVLVAGFLRFFDITKVPHGLYIDEASIGYNAYTILTTGKDEHGEPFPVFFKAFGEYKLPVYIYLTSGSIALFGKDDFAVRFPSAFFGVLTVVLFYFLLKKLLEFDKEKKKSIKYLPFVGTLLLAISPWHIHFSRGGFESNVALFFYLLGWYLALFFWSKKKLLFFALSAIAFVIALYTYNTYRIIVPITLLSFVVFFFKKLPKLRKSIILTAVVSLILSIPLIQFALSSNGNARFASESAFVEYPAEKVADKVMVYPMVFLKDYFSFFSAGFLFSMGDGNGRHQVPSLGLFYKWQIPFLLLGLFWLLRQKHTVLKYFTLGLLIITPLVPALVRPSPHSLRAELLVIPLTILIAFGLVSCFEYIKKYKKVVIMVIFIFVSLEFIYYQHLYHSHYPNVNALDWGGGLKETAQKANILKSKYNYVVLDSNVGFAPIYFKYYAPELQLTIVDVAWNKPSNWKGDVLFIRPYYGKKEDKNIIDQVYLPGPNKDIYTQFWKL